MNKVINWYDPIAHYWRHGYFLCHTSTGNTVIETFKGSVVVLPRGTARLCDIGAEYEIEEKKPGSK